MIYQQKTNWESNDFTYIKDFQEVFFFSDKINTSNDFKRLSNGCETQLLVLSLADRGKYSTSIFHSYS